MEKFILNKILEFFIGYNLKELFQINFFFVKDSIINLILTSENAIICPKAF